MTKGRLNSFLVWAAPVVIALIMRAWFKTCRVTVHNDHYLPKPEEQKSRCAVASFWHYSLLFNIYYMRKHSAAVMVSASRDGDYIARLAEQFGFTTARGSRNKKGVEALRSLMRSVKNGDNCAIVADGSQGPPLIAQPGALLLASRAKVPVIPLVWSASNYFTIRSWDRTAIPKPFSTIHLFIGEPFVVPHKMDSEKTEEFRLLLETKLNTMYKEAWSLFDRESH